MSFSVAVKIHNADEIARLMGRAPAIMRKHFKRAMYLVTLTIMRESMKNTPVDTGRLRASHNVKLSRGSFGLVQGRIFTQTNYDIFVHEGTRFMKGRPFMHQAVKENQEKTKQFFTDSVDNAIKELSR